MILFLFLLAIFVIISIAVQNTLIKKDKEQEKREYEEEQIARKQQEIAKKQQQKREKEKLRLEKIKCNICNQSSMGKFLCTTCWNKAKAIETELPNKKINSYFSTHEYQKELMKEILSNNDTFKKQYNLLQLYNIDKIIADKYYDKSYLGQSFIKDYKTSFEKEVLIKKYELNIPVEKTAKKQEHSEKATGDFRTLFPKPYRCKDGDYVRSKAEREIDDFFYDNKIWHIYEQEYKHPVTGKTADPDFYLPDYNLYIEYFGLSDPDYIKRREEKIKMYNSDPNIKFEYLTYKDDYFIYDKLKKLLEKHNIKTK